MGLNGEQKTLFEHLCSRGNSQFGSKMAENESHEVSAAGEGGKIGLGFWAGGFLEGLFWGYFIPMSAVSTVVGWHVRC